jgi:hypothetical protein
MAKASKPRRRTKVSLQPYRQGALDGLCGVYSVVNALRLLCPEVDNDTAEHLFDLLTQKLLRTAGNHTTVITWGIGRMLLRSLLDEATTYMLDDFDIRLRARRLPKALRDDGNRDELWQALSEVVSPSCVAILGLAGKHSHWTVATTVTPLSIRLFDSGKLKALPRARCTVRKTRKRHQIEPRHVVLVERMT